MDFISRRIASLRMGLREKNIDSAFITKRENYLYLSGFTGSSAYLVITQEDAYLLTDSRYVEQACAQAPDFTVIQHQPDPGEDIERIVKKSDIKTLGFEEGFLTYEKYIKYKKRLDTVELVPLEGLIEKLRSVKDESEMEAIKKAIEIADRAFAHVLNFIKPGISEIEIAAEIEYYMKKHGASGTSFETIVASGYRASMPHAVASEKPIEAGDAVTLDFGAVYRNYCSDITRTIFVGTPDKELEKVYHIVLEAQVKAIEGTRAGMKGAEIDSIARQHIAQNGYGDRFGHGLGHGVGLEIHEMPNFSRVGETIIENGMVVTVEPGIYLPGVGGVRIEDIIVVVDDRPVILTNSPKDMIVL